MMLRTVRPISSSSARVDLDWIDLHSIRATIYERDGWVLTHALLEREVLTWRVVDVDLPEAGK